MGHGRTVSGQVGKTKRERVQALHTALLVLFIGATRLEPMNGVEHTELAGEARRGRGSRRSSSSRRPQVSVIRSFRLLRRWLGRWPVVYSLRVPEPASTGSYQDMYVLCVAPAHDGPSWQRLQVSVTIGQCRRARRTRLTTDVALCDQKGMLTRSRKSVQV